MDGQTDMRAGGQTDGQTDRLFIQISLDIIITNYIPKTDDRQIYRHAGGWAGRWVGTQTGRHAGGWVGKRGGGWAVYPTGYLTKPTLIIERRYLLVTGFSLHILW